MVSFDIGDMITGQFLRRTAAAGSGVSIRTGLGRMSDTMSMSPASERVSVDASWRQRACLTPMQIERAARRDAHRNHNGRLRASETMSALPSPSAHARVAATHAGGGHGASLVSGEDTEHHTILTL